MLTCGPAQWAEELVRNAACNYSGELTRCLANLKVDRHIHSLVGTRRTPSCSISNRALRCVLSYSLLVEGRVDIAAS